jgi:hypothetical protein
MRAVDLFPPLMDLERAVAELYERWAADFAADPDAGRLWAQMANEEKNHARVIEGQWRLLQQDPMLGGDVNISPEWIEGTIGVVRGAITGPPFSLEGAVLFACAFENSVAETHFTAILRQDLPVLAALLDRLGKEDRLHLERLEAFAKERGILVPDAGT